MSQLAAAKPPPMPDPRRPGRENYKTKARRLLIENCVFIREVTVEGTVKATVRGEHDFYEVTCTPQGYWQCACIAKGRCSHVEAVSLVTRH